MLLHSHVTDAFLGISAVLCYRYPSIATGCHYPLMSYERLKRVGFGIREHCFLSDTESIKNLSLCPVRKFHTFTQSDSPIIPHIISADSYKVEFAHFSPAKSSHVTSYGTSVCSLTERFLFLQTFFALLSCLRYT